MVRLTLALVVSLTACGGAQPQAKEKPAERLSVAEQCIRDANREQTPPIDAPERIDVAHIIVKHDQVKGAVKEDISRTREEACLRAEEARKFLLAEKDWDAGFKKYSDGGGATEGVLYGVGQLDLDKAFANAAFSLQPDELSYVVESPRGFHVILRQK